MVSITKIKLSFKTKLIIAFSTVLMVILSLALSHYYWEASKAFNESLRSKLISVAATAALQINPQLHSTLKERKDENTPAYREIKKTLQAIKEANPQIRFVYTMVMSPEENIWMYVVDAEENPELISHLGDLEDVSQWNYMQKAFEGPTADMEIEEDNWGYSLSGYAPIYNDMGEAIAIIGIDMSAEKVILEQRKLQQEAALIFIIALALAVFLSSILANHFCKPLVKLVEGTQQISMGNLDYQVQIESSREMAALAQSFNIMVTELRSSRRHLENLARTDALTMLLNHRSFQDSLEMQIQKAAHNRQTFCLIFGDLDNFKTFNDLFGHLHGDRVLKDVADVIRSNIRPRDLAFRYGGEEMAIILPDTGEDDGLLVAEKIREAVENYSVAYLNQNKFMLTISIGLAVYPQDAQVKKELLEKSDRAMFYAKEMGRNQVKIYSREKEHLEFIDRNEAAKKHLLLNSIHALRAAVDAKDHYTQEHSDSVAGYASDLAKALRLPPQEIQALYQAGLLHDIGKIGISDSILQKKGILTPEEWGIIQTHPVLGTNILKHIPGFQPLLPLVLYHHERIDGTGYPNGLKGNDIPLGARILAIADAYDAMISDRPYRKAMTKGAALQEIQKNAGNQFDLELTKIFIHLASSADKTVLESSPG